MAGIFILSYIYYAILLFMFSPLFHLVFTSNILKPHSPFAEASLEMPVQFIFKV